MASLIERLRVRFEQYPDAKLGFVVYRTTYEDEKAWMKFIDLLTTQTIARIKDSALVGLEDRLDWNIQEDRETLNSASYATVRDHFRKWVADEKEPNHGMARHRVCILIDSWAVASMGNWNVGKEEFNILPTTWVRLLSKNDEGRTIWEEQGISDEEEDENEDEESDRIKTGEMKSEKEEVKTDQISICMVALSYVFPRTFELLEGPGWHNFAHPWDVVKE
ncbi:hypothetical protein P154DRAFT_621094 [Amniculicola lignicola CBS 123094]|uniref:Uncharacterized protein n=1 Tax=Amniculicola lignicola CBS 123094 TaxID=1392246 RepID=A0A6A5WBJ6_9PLEO|nr:hypothetical protein P154DRAFT_621094 [Amniculicola lignicola CBS 123094]